MRFAFSDDQLALGEAVRELMANECPPEALRTAWSSPTGVVPGLWEQLASMGLPGLCIDESLGGLGFGVVDAALPLVACGWAGVPDPVADTAVIAPALLGAAGRSDLLEGIATEAHRVVVAPVDTPFFAGAEQADVLVVVGRRVERGGAGFAALVDREQISLEPVESVDGGRRLTRGVARRGVGDWGDVLEVSPVDVDRTLDRGAVATACLLLGLCERMLELTVSYVRERQQFGVAIGSFQAIKHHCADALLALDMARPVVWRAAWSLTNLDHDDPSVGVHASMAKAFASDAAATVAQHALQCHAGIGYSTEYDLHLYMKRAWALQRAWGDAAQHRRQVAAAVLDD